MDIWVKKGDWIRVTEGTFENHQGVVDSVDEQSGRVSVIIEIFGRPTLVEVMHWQLEIL
jgi:transcriptional antiterminator NusG